MLWLNIIKINRLYRLGKYAALIEQYDLDVIPNWHTSMVTIRGTHRIDFLGGIIKEVYPSRYWPEERHWVTIWRFALKYDGTNLAILANLFQKVSEDDFLDYCLLETDR